MLGDRHRLRLLIPAHIEKAAMRVAQRIVAPARDADAAPAAPAGTVGAQAHAVAPVRQQMRRVQRHLAGGHFAQQARRAPLQGLRRRARRRRIQHRHLARCALVQQRGHRLDVRVGHAPALRHAAQQHVGQRHDAHALVVRHEGAHRREQLGARAPYRAEVERFDEAVAPARGQRLQGHEVGGGEVRRNLRGQRGGVGRNDQLVGRRAAQRQPGHALWRVLIGQRVVAAGVGRLRNAPGHALRIGKSDLL